MSDSEHPEPMEQLKRRRAELVAEKARLAIVLRSSKGSERERALTRTRDIDATLTALNAKIDATARQENEEKRVWVTDGTQRVRAVKDALAGVWEYIATLEQQIIELREENERLKQQRPQGIPF